MDGREKKDTYFKHHFWSHQSKTSSRGKHPTSKHGFQTCGTVYLKDGFSLGPSRWDIFCGKKLGKLDHKKPQVLGGGIPADTSPRTRLHLEEMLNLVTTSLTICHSTRDEPICLFGDVE